MITAERKRLLITGHPRSGTGYMARLAQACGLDVGHEEMRADGISSWLMGPPVYRVCFHRKWESRGRLWYEFDRAIEVVREPLACIASVAFTENRGHRDSPDSLRWRAQWTPCSFLDSDDTIEQAVYSVVGWHRRMREWLPDATTIRLEHAATDLPAALGVAPPADPGVVNARRHRSLTWDDVRDHCDGKLWSDLMEHCDDCGYRRPNG